MAEGVCDYELQMLANKKRNEEALRRFGVGGSLITQSGGAVQHSSKKHSKRRPRTLDAVDGPPRRSTRERPSVSYEGMGEENTGFTLAPLPPLRAARLTDSRSAAKQPPVRKIGKRGKRNPKCSFRHNLLLPKGYQWACDPPRGKNKKDGGQGTKVRSTPGVYFDNEVDCAKDYDKWARGPEGQERAKRDKYGKLLVHFPRDVTTEARIPRRNWLPQESETPRRGLSPNKLPLTRPPLPAIPEQTQAPEEQVLGQPVAADNDEPDFSEWNASVPSGNDAEVSSYVGGNDLDPSANLNDLESGMNLFDSINQSEWASDDSAGDTSPVDDNPSSPKSSAMWMNIESVNSIDHSPGFNCGLSDGIAANREATVSSFDVDSLLSPPSESPPAASTAFEHPAQLEAATVNVPAAAVVVVKPNCQRWVDLPEEEFTWEEFSNGKLDSCYANLTCVHLADDYMFKIANKRVGEVRRLTNWGGKGGYGMLKFLAYSADASEHYKGKTVHTLAIQRRKREVK